MGELVLIIFVGVIYFIPSFWAMDKRNTGAIFVLNLFLGWTLIGWVGALIWAIIDKDKEPVRRKHPLNYDTKLSMCPYCNVMTKTYCLYQQGLGDLKKCAECNGVKG
jgi:hypothetical protein